MEEKKLVAIISKLIGIRSEILQSRTKVKDNAVKLITELIEELEQYQLPF